MADFYATYPSEGVTSVNGLEGALTLAAGSGITLTPVGNTITIAASGSGGSVTSVALAAPSIFTVTGSPVTTSGTLTLSYSGTALPIANGGTGQTSAASAINALLPTQTSHAGEFLTTNGTVASWAAGGSSGANTALSNLATTAINADLLFDADDTYRIGTDINAVQEINVGVINSCSDILDSVSAEAIAVTSRVLYSTDGTIMLDWSNSDFLSINADLLPTSNAINLGNDSLPFGALYVGTIVDTANVVSIDIEARQLKDGDGNGVLSWNSQLHVNASIIPDDPNANLGDTSTPFFSLTTARIMGLTGNVMIDPDLYRINRLDGQEILNFANIDQITYFVPAPASASDTGTPGAMAWDTDYIYLCTDVDTWKRVAVSTW